MSFAVGTHKSNMAFVYRGEKFCVLSFISVSNFYEKFRCGYFFCSLVLSTIGERFLLIWLKMNIELEVISSKQSTQSTVRQLITFHCSNSYTQIISPTTPKKTHWITNSICFFSQSVNAVKRLLSQILTIPNDCPAV